MAKAKKNGILLIVNGENTYLHFLREKIIGVFPEIHIESANSGEKALQLLTKREFALVITDSILPGMGGLNFFLEARRAKPTVKIILLSTGLDKGTERALNQKGLYGYLQKPFLMESLSELIAKTLYETEDIHINGKKADQGSRR